MWYLILQLSFHCIKKWGPIAFWPAVLCSLLIWGGGGEVSKYQSVPLRGNVGRENVVTRISRLTKNDQVIMNTLHIKLRREKPCFSTNLIFELWPARQRKTSAPGGFLWLAWLNSARAYIVRPYQMLCLLLHLKCLANCKIPKKRNPGTSKMWTRDSNDHQSFIPSDK